MKAEECWMRREILSTISISFQAVPNNNSVNKGQSNKAGA